jgi:uncharacterized protein with FMN-binding domain
MKRFPVVIGATVAGLVGILSFHSRGTTGLSSQLSVKTNSPSQGSKSAGPAQSTTTTTTTAAGPSAPPSSTTTTSPGAAASVPSSAVGAQEQYGYGVLSVRATVSNSKISDVQVATLQTAESYSQQLANQVIPYLRRQVLSVQSAKINGISGATYTSEAYAYSLQSALDKLHFR